jgi:hypothetical protein
VSRRTRLKERRPARPTGPRLEPPARVEFYGSEVANGEPSVLFDQRRSRCYELATWTAIHGSVPRGTVLVHGNWHGPGAPARIGHAWLRLPDGSVWEPIRHRLYVDPLAWEHWTGAREEVRYSQHQATRLVLAHDTYGPWHEPRYR